MRRSSPYSHRRARATHRSCHPGGRYHCVAPPLVGPAQHRTTARGRHHGHRRVDAPWRPFRCGRTAAQCCDRGRRSGTSKPTPPKGRLGRFTRSPQRLIGSATAADLKRCEEKHIRQGSSYIMYLYVMVCRFLRMRM